MCKPAVIHIESNKWFALSFERSIAFLLFAFCLQRNSICRCENEIGDCNFHTECHHFVYIFMCDACVYITRSICRMANAYNIHPRFQCQQYCIKWQNTIYTWTMRNNNITKLWNRTQTHKHMHALKTMLEA